MKRNIIYTMILLVSSTFSNQAISEEVVSSVGKIELNGTGWDGVDPEYNYSDANGPLYLYPQGGRIVEGSGLVFSYGGGLENRAEFISEGHLKANNGELCIGIKGKGAGGWAYSPQGGGRVEILWYDEVVLVKNKNDTSLLSEKLVFNFIFDGFMETNSAEIGGSAGAEVSANFIGGENIQQIHYSLVSPEGESIGAIKSFSSEFKVTTRFPILFEDQNENKSYKYDYIYGINGSAGSTFGIALLGITPENLITCGISMKLLSITFQDGTTPESHGWNLAFKSGIKSPNPTPILRHLPGILNLLILK